MPSRPHFFVQPQRSDGRGYVPCEVHAATSWAVVREDKVTRAGKEYKVTRTIGRYATRTLARGHAEANNRRFEPLAKHLVRKLGRRIVKEDC